ncbi:MAG: hypothetical protein H6719_33260 [Sandaracinaceae bacterium]|nr:hypothetical protein [Sandaracinaceae bacterium]
MSVLPSARRSALIGRDRDIEALSLRIDGGARLITLVGPGGVGKSRLAAEVADRFGARFEGGVVLVDLTRIRDGAELPRLVLEAMGSRGWASTRSLRR